MGFAPDERPLAPKVVGRRSRSITSRCSATNQPSFSLLDSARVSADRRPEPCHTRTSADRQPYEWHSEGHVFESPRVHQSIHFSNTAARKPKDRVDLAPAVDPDLRD